MVIQKKGCLRCGIVAESVHSLFRTNEGIMKIKINMLLKKGLLPTGLALSSLIMGCQPTSEKVAANDNNPTQGVVQSNVEVNQP